MSASGHAEELRHVVLKEKHRRVRDAHPTNLSLRIHRALSWLDRAEQAEDDDARFIFLWIAFNAAYAQETEDSDRTTDKAAFTAFLEKLCDLDVSGRVDDLIWREFSSSVRVLLDNPYVFFPFWEYQRGRLDADTWKARFASAKRAAQAALGAGNTPVLLSIIFNRLYSLRNQIIHGGATWDGRVNREQVRDSTRLMAKLVPTIILIMMDSPDTLWGDAVYPVVELER